MRAEGNGNDEANEDFKSLEYDDDRVGISISELSSQTIVRITPCFPRSTRRRCIRPISGGRSTTMENVRAAPLERPRRRRFFAIEEGGGRERANGL